MMSETKILESVIKPVAFWQTGDILHRAIDKVYDAAEEEIEDVLQQTLRLASNDPNSSISSWSLRISSWGLEIVTAPIEEWMRERDRSTLSYTHNFLEGDTIAWLFSIANQHRDALKSALVEYALRNIGYSAIHSSNAFMNALETNAPATPKISVAAGDEIPW